jgi:non-ribosomal peptide synthase protein (TIGR01720 family)
MYVLDKHLEPVPPGVVGELYIGGDGVARGYLGRPALTADRFLPDPFGLPGARFYRTGDLARVRPEGNLDFLGRTDHQVKVRGYRIELGEIEAQLLLSPAVREAVVAVRQDRHGAKKLVAYVVPATADAEPAALRDALRAVLPDYMVPATFVLMDALPLSAGGKVDRRLLPAPAGAGGSPAAPSRRRTDQERTLARLWAELLDLPGVDVGDNFFEIGGDSLLAIQLTVRARSEGLTLTPRLVFQHQTLEELAAAAGPAEPELAQPSLAQPSLARPSLAQHGPTGGADRAEVLMSPSQLRLLSSGVRHEYHVPVELAQLRAPVAADDLEQILHELVARHQALRLRVDPLTGRQHAVPAETARLLRTVPASGARPAEVAEALRGDLDLASGPLLQAALIEGNGTRALMLAAHHFAVDGVSWQVLLDELAALWPGASREPLPPAGLQFSAWTARLHALAASAELTAEAQYWLGQEPGVSIPVDMPAGRNTADTARTITTVLPAEQTLAIQQCSRARTSDLLFSALARVLTDWTGGTSATVEVSGHGRGEFFAGADPASTVGWLSCGYPVTLRPSADRDPLAEVAAVSRQLREVPRSGIGYGLLRYLRDDEIAGRLAQVRIPDVLVNYEGRHRSGGDPDLPFFRLADAPDVEAAGAGARTHLLQVGSAVVDGELTIGWTYSDQVHSEGTIAQLAEDCLGWLRSLARQER